MSNASMSDCKDPENRVRKIAVVVVIPLMIERKAKLIIQQLQELK